MHAGRLPATHRLVTQLDQLAPQPPPPPSTPPPPPTACKAGSRGIRRTGRWTWGPWPLCLSHLHLCLFSFISSLPPRPFSFSLSSLSMPVCDFPRVSSVLSHLYLPVSPQPLHICPAPPAPVLLTQGSAGIICKGPGSQCCCLRSHMVLSRPVAVCSGHGCVPIKLYWKSRSGAGLGAGCRQQTPVLAPFFIGPCCLE